MSGRRRDGRPPPVSPAPARADRRRLLRGAAGAAALALGGPAPARPAADAPPWPQRALRIVLAYPAGGVSDAIARTLAALLSARLQRPVLVVHRPGAGGSLAIEQLLRFPADGHTLCFCATSALTLLPLLRPVGYDPLRDVQPVIPVMATPVLVLGTPALPARTLPEAMAWARERPGGLRWATTGVGTTGHLVLARVGEGAGVRLTHVPYKGGGQPLNDALAGHFEVLSSNVAAAQLQHVRSGRLHALAVGAPARLAVLPAVPTLAEAGFPQANLMSVFGLFVAASTPPALVQRLNHALDAVLRDPALRERLHETDNVPLGGGAADFARQVAEEHAAHRRRAPAADGGPAG